MDLVLLGSVMGSFHQVSFVVRSGTRNILTSSSASSLSCFLINSIPRCTSVVSVVLAQMHHLVCYLKH